MNVSPISVINVNLLQTVNSLTRHMDKVHKKSNISDIKDLEQEGSEHTKFACMQCFATIEERKNLNKHI